MSKDGGGYGGDEGVALVSLASQVRTLKIQIEGYRQHIQIVEKSYKEHVDRLKTKVQMNIHNSAFNGLLDENKELKQDLKWALATIENTMPELYDSDEEETAEVEERLKEIKGRLNE
jgi:hypothetical protein